MIQRRDTHLESLVDKLKEDRVKLVIQAIINGESLTFDILDDDLAYLVVFDLRDRSWDEKIFRKELEYKGKKISWIGI